MSQRDSIIYVGDPMCSWCYGFAPEINEVKEYFGDQKEFVLVMGGLRPYNKETMADLGEFLTHHWEDVANKSNQPFNYGILKNKEFVYDTEPAARAVWVVRKIKPEAEFDFFKDVQTMFYAQNLDTRKVDSYSGVCAENQIDFSRFKTTFESEEAKNGIKMDFQYSAQLGVKGFPSVVYVRNGKHYLLANGYVKAKTLIRSIESIP